MSFVGCKNYDDDINGLQNQIDSLKSGQIADIYSQIASIKAILDDLKNADAAINQAIKDLQDKTAQLSEADAALENLINGKFAELQNSLNDLAARVAANEASIGDVQSWADQMDKWVDALETDLYDEKDGWFVLITQNFQTLSGNDQYLLGLIEDLQAALQSLQDTHGSDMATVQGAVTALNNALAEFKSEVNGEIERLEGQINDLRGELTQAIHDQIAALEQMISDNYVNNTAYEEFTRQTLERMQALTEAIDRINAIIPMLATKAELTALRDQIAGWLGDYVKKEIFDQVTGELSQRLTDEINALNGQISDITDALNALKADAEANAAAIEALQTRLTALESNVATLVSDLASLREEFASFQTAIRNEIATALEELEGRIDEEISSAIAEAVAGINARIDGIEERLAGLEVDVDALINRIQSIVYKPDFSDGKISIEFVGAQGNGLVWVAGVKPTVTRFQVRPADAAAQIVSAWSANKSVLEYSTIDVQTRSASETGCELIIKDVQASSDGILTVTSVLNNYDSQLIITDTRQYSVSLVLSNPVGESNVNNDIQTTYVNLKGTIDQNGIVNFVIAEQDPETGNVALVNDDPEKYNGELANVQLGGYDFPYNDLDKIDTLTKNMVPAIWKSGTLMTLEEFGNSVGVLSSLPSITFIDKKEWNPISGEKTPWSGVEDAYELDEAAAQLKLAASDPANVGKGAAVEYGIQMTGADALKHTLYSVSFLSKIIPVPTQAVLAPAIRNWHYPQDVTATVVAGADSYAVKTILESEQLQGNKWSDILAVTPTVYLVDDPAAQHPTETVADNITLAKNGTEFTVTFAGAADFSWNATYNIKAVYSLPSSDVTVYATVTAVKPTAITATVAAADPIQWEYGRTENYVVSVPGALDALWAGADEGIEPTDHFAAKTVLGEAIEALAGTPQWASTYNTAAVTFQTAPYMYLNGADAVIWLNNANIAEENVFVNTYDLDGVTVALTVSTDMALPVYSVQNNGIKLDNRPNPDGYTGYWAQLAGRYTPDYAALELFTLENADLYECFIVKDAAGNIIQKADMAALGLSLSFGMAPVNGVQITDGIMTYMSPEPYVSVMPTLMLDGQPDAYKDVMNAYAPFRVYPTNPIKTSVTFVGGNEIQMSAVGAGSFVTTNVWNTITLEDTRGYKLFDPAAATLAEYKSTVTGDGTNGFANGVTAADAYQGLAVNISGNIKAYRYIDNRKADAIPNIALAGLSFDPNTGVLTYTNNNVVNTSDVLVEIPVVFRHSWGFVTTLDTPIQVILRK